MKILRRRRVILVFLVLIWVGGMAYFLTNLSTKDESFTQDYQGDLGKDSSEDFLLREKQEHRQTREQREEKKETLVSIFNIIQT